MWYIDLEYNGEKYRGVYFNSYRLNQTTITNVSPVSSYTYQDDAGYSLNTAYWFKYEPIILLCFWKRVFIMTSAFSWQNYRYLSALLCLLTLLGGLLVPRKEE